MINIYLDSFQSALKYLKNTEVNINNVLIIIEDFNIRDSFWDSYFPHHSLYRDFLFDIAGSFQLVLSKSTEFFPTRYSDNNQDSNLALDLIFLWLFSIEFDNYHIHPDWRLSSDYTPITVNILIFEECIPIKKWSLIKNSKEKNHFIEELANSVKQIDISHIQSIEALENIVQVLVFNINSIWFKYSKCINITKHSKSWWNKDCCTDINKYWQFQSLKDWKKFKKMVKRTKCVFFDDKINKISNKKCSPWELMNWVNKCKLPAIEFILFNGWSYIELDNL